ncbi:MAG: glycogen/starch/alpha-glucan phosphorylase [Syntrophomonadaceae bacterium]|nr:glycogen/starch/alpha-glucan phosphorylase [Syntrophomonadaceae bacterium]
MFQNKQEFIHEFKAKFAETEGNFLERGEYRDYYRTLVSLILEKISFPQLDYRQQTLEQHRKQVYYFSMEFLIGRLLPYYLMNLGIADIVREGFSDMGIDAEAVMAEERDAGLGNGGLGRLAACYLSSMAFLGIPVYGNGIRYKYGLFRQKLENGQQVETPDDWMSGGYPWERRRDNRSVLVKFKGNIKVTEEKGGLMFEHENYDSIRAVPYDIPIIGYEGLRTITGLRLWSAEPVEDAFDLHSFNKGARTADTSRADAESISYILYPEDSSQAGQELRLKQEYFFVAAGLGTIMRTFRNTEHPLASLPAMVSVHINDTHPALCVPELMRILIDEEHLAWEEAWQITVNTISYTNHTIMPEALERWPVNMFRYLLPRIYMIVEEIDRRYRESIMRLYPEDDELLERTAVISHDYVHMSNLAVIGSYSVNGVAALHTEILKHETMKDFYRLYPYKFNNKTNGVDYRRFLALANPELSRMITDRIGDGWLRDAAELERLLHWQDDEETLEELARIKLNNKRRLAAYIEQHTGVAVDPHSIFDVQVKRIHAYKRQLMNALRIAWFYNRLKEDRDMAGIGRQPVTFIFAGKAAPGYHYAKTVIRFINALAAKINDDPEINHHMKVIFIENFNVSIGELIYPAADVSEQISTASREASGTGNMKFMFNGAVTLGTLDGANVEIHEAVGEENMMIFGMRSEEVIGHYRRQDYHSWQEYHRHPELKQLLDQLKDGFWTGQPGDFTELYESLLHYNDQFFVLKDFWPYVESSGRLLRIYKYPAVWQRMALANIAKAGRFSSDRSIREYARDIWKMDI